MTTPAVPLSQQALVRVRGAVVRFGDRAALDGVDLIAEPGTVTAVVGGDGAGKTTLLRTLVGQVPLSAGTVHTPPLADVGYLPASQGSWRGLTVQQNLDFVGGSYAVPPQRLAERSADLLAAAELSEFTDRPAGQLSGGMRRKLGVCMAMLHDPSLLVLDEPSTGVDPVSRVELWGLAARAAANGATVVMSTTYLDEAARAAHVVVLDQGRVLVAGPPHQLTEQLPGVVTAAPRPVRTAWAWRRGRRFHELWPTAETPPADVPAVAPDLEDVAVAWALLRAHGGSAAVTS